MHWVGSLYGEPNDVIGLWDWCNAITFTKFYDLTPGSSFSNTYVRNQVDEWGHTHSVYFMVVQPSNFSLQPTDYDCWNVYFYDFNTGSYDNMSQQNCGVSQIVAQGGDPAIGTGWTMHETNGIADYYNGAPCPNIPAVDVGDVILYVYSNGSLYTPHPQDDPSYWGELDQSVTPNCFDTGTWTFEENPSYDGYWFAWTPATN